MPKITREMRNSMDGVIPSPLATCSGEGIPNVTYISQVYYVDETHVAISFQFMNKSWRNMLENPYVTTLISCPNSGKKWLLRLKFVEEQREGPLFDDMEMQLMAVATIHNAPVDWKLLAALVCELEEIEEVYSE